MMAIKVISNFNYVTIPTGIIWGLYDCTLRDRAIKIVYSQELPIFYKYLKINFNKKLIFYYFTGIIQGGFAGLIFPYIMSAVVFTHIAKFPFDIINHITKFPFDLVDHIIC